MSDEIIKKNEERAKKYYQWLDEHQDFKTGTPEQQAKYKSFLEAYKIARENMTPSTDKITVTGKEEPFDFSAKEMVKNFLPSLYREGQDIAYALTNPKETLGSLWNLAGGVIQKLDPTGALGTDKEKYVEALGQHYANKYGSFDAFKKELQNNPAGVMADASMFVTGGATGVRLGASTTKALTKSKTAADIAGKAKTIAKVGASIDPFNVALNTAGVGIGQTTRLFPESERWAEQLYGKALKPSTTLPIDQRRRIIQTALQEKLPITEKGTEILQSRINELNSRVNKLIDTAVDDGTKIPSSVVFKYFDDIKNEVGGFKIEAAEDLSEIANIEQKFKKWIKKIGKDEFITPKEMQQFKIDINDKINWKKVNLKSPSPAQEKAYLGLSRGAKESIAETIPEVADINAELSRLLELQPYLIRGADRIGNRDIVGIGGGVKAAGGRAVGGDVGAAAGVAAGVLDFPRVKSGLGILLDEYRNRPLQGLLDNQPTRPLITQGLSEIGDINYGQGLLPYSEIEKLYK